MLCLTNGRKETQESKKNDFEFMSFALFCGNKQLKNEAYI